jgi:hypothetical protein
VGGVPIAPVARLGQQFAIVEGVADPQRGDRDLVVTGAANQRYHLSIGTTSSGLKPLCKL